MEEEINIKDITLPLSPKDMVEFFKNKDQHYVVDLYGSKSNMSERAMLLYLANLGIKCSFRNVSPELMEEYMVLKDFVNAPMLTAIHANILYFLKYQEIPYPPGLEDFSEEEIVNFIDNHENLLIEQGLFLDSFLLYIETRREGYNSPSHNEDNDLHDELGFSLLKLLSFEDFMIIFSKKIPPMELMTYYTKYFDEYMFKGNNLFHYAHTSSLFGMVKLLKDAKVS